MDETSAGDGRGRQVELNLPLGVGLRTLVSCLVSRTFNSDTAGHQVIFIDSFVSTTFHFSLPFNIEKEKEKATLSPYALFQEDTSKENCLVIHSITVTLTIWQKGTLVATFVYLH